MGGLSNPKVIAVCKTFSGHEFVTAMIESVLPEVDGILFLHSEVSWSGKTGNTVSKVVNESLREHGPANVMQEWYNTTSQQAQYDRAIMSLQERGIDYDYLLLVDTDEVWDSGMIKALVAQADRCPAYSAFACCMHTYLKTPFLKVTPKEWCDPTVLIRKGIKIIGPRGNFCPNKKVLTNIFFHHFTGVRNSLKAVIDKFWESTAVENQTHVPIEYWVENFWNTPLTAKRFHIVEGAEVSWNGIVKVNRSDLPLAMRNHPLVLSFEKYEQDGEPVVMRSEVTTTPEKVLLHREGTLMIYTMVDANYLPYLPIFVWCANKAEPDATIEIDCRSGPETKESTAIANLIWDTYPKVNFHRNCGDGCPDNGYTTAALRFVESPHDAETYDYTLITDADILMMPEETSIIDQHCNQMQHDRTLCYENWMIGEKPPQMAGVHFVTREWWKITEAARQTEFNRLQKHGSLGKGYDEIMLAHIVECSGLTRPKFKGAKLWRNHGSHLGNIRHCVERGHKYEMFAEESNFLHSLANDKEFGEIASMCSRYSPEIEAIWRRIKSMFGR